MRGRDSYPVWREIATRWSDNDAYGHVNNTVHYAWFDTAVNGWLIEAGLLDIAAGILWPSTWVSTSELERPCGTWKWPPSG